MQIDLPDAWAWWFDGSPGLRDAHLWGLAVKSWGLIGGIVLLLGLVALAMDVAASPSSHRPTGRRAGMGKLVLRLVVTGIVFMVIVGFVNAFREEMQETGRSAWFVASAGDDNIDWKAAPRWYTLGFPSLIVLAFALSRRDRLHDWLDTILRKGPKAVLPRLLAALVLLAALNFAVLAA